MTTIKDVPGLVQQLYRVVGRLGEIPGAEDRSFTPDGHLVGSIGEVLAAHDYGLRLFPNSYPTHDAITKTGIHVQIKITQGKQIGLREKPEHLLVLYLDPATGQHEEVFNGPSDAMWRLVGKKQSNGQRQISLAKLRAVQDSVPPRKRIRRI